MYKENTLTLALSMYSNKGAYAVLCGAGISRSSGIPTAWNIEEDLIKKIAAVDGVFKSEDWHDWYKNKFGREATYSGLLQQITQTSTERVGLMKSYFEPTADDIENNFKIPTKAHKAIAVLAKSGYVRVVLSPNFDRLFEKAFIDAHVPFQTVYNSSDWARITPLATFSGVTVVKFNGDYQDCQFKNTESELGVYDAEMEKHLQRIFEDFGLITCGWSAQWDKALIDIMNSSKTRYGSFYTYVGKVGDTLSELARNRDGLLLGIQNADSFFDDLSEQVMALERVNASSNLDSDIFVSRVKKYLRSPDYRIDLADLIEQEGKRACHMILNESDYNFSITPGVFSHYLELHKTAVEKLVPAFITIVRWGKLEDMYLFDDVLIRLCIKPFKNGECFREGTQYLHLLSAALLVNVIGMASVKYNNYRYLEHLFELKVPAPNIISVNREFLLLYLTQNLWGKEMLNSYLSNSNYYFPWSELLREQLKPWFENIFLDVSQYDACYYVWEHLHSLLFAYYKCDLFESTSEVNYPIGSFIRYRLREMQRCQGFYFNYWNEIEQLKDKCPLIQQGLFNGDYVNLKKCKDDADSYFKTRSIY